MKNVLPFIVLLLILISCATKKSEKSELAKTEKDTKESIEVKQLKEAVLFEGTLERVEHFPSKYIKERPVDIWLPKNYSKDQKYAVLYMHDGQNLFDATTTWNQQEWKVDDWASKLMQQKKVRNFIVVGIHNISDLRWHDLFPEKAINHIPKQVFDSIKKTTTPEDFGEHLKGDEYLKFLVEELKPYIDKKYATLSNQENTFVGGSSMGGLMSMYAITQYPEIFYGAACISTHWTGIMPVENNPFPEAILKYLETNVPSPKNHKFYFDYGTKTIDQHYGKYASKVDSIFYTKGYTENNFKNLKFEDADHSENSWNKRLDTPLLFLLQNQ